MLAMYDCQGSLYSPYRSGVCSEGGGTQFESQNEAGKFLADSGTVSAAERVFC
jgi:hypothetical protein